MHPVSRATTIVANATACPYNRLEQHARILIHTGVLPMASGRAVPNVTPAQLLALVAAAVMAPRILDAPSVAEGFHSLREHRGHNSGAATFGAFWSGLMADTRDDQIEIELVRAFDFRQASQFEARVIINGERLIVFGEPKPPLIAREEAVRISPRAFRQLREDFNSAEPVAAREYAR